jgi:hypothetical protein
MSEPEIRTETRDHDDARPDGSTSNTVYASLDAALEERGIPLENRPLIRSLADYVGIARVEGTTGYLKAVRAGGGPALLINYGWTSGFVSEEEARDAAGDTEVDAWPSERGTGRWGVSHPVHRMRDTSGSRTAPEERDYGSCPDCFVRRSATGACLCSD